MKLTKSKLKQIIKEETAKLLQEKGVMYGKMTTDEIKKLLGEAHPGKVATVDRTGSGVNSFSPVKYVITYETWEDWN
jgi:hypothetical protein